MIHFTPGPIIRSARSSSDSAGEEKLNAAIARATLLFGGKNTELSRGNRTPICESRMRGHLFHRSSSRSVFSHSMGTIRVRMGAIVSRDCLQTIEPIPCLLDSEGAGTYNGRR